jgi:hypothetical protein
VLCVDAIARESSLLKGGEGLFELGCVVSEFEVEF